MSPVANDTTAAELLGALPADQREQFSAELQAVRQMTATLLVAYGERYLSWYGHVLAGRALALVHQAQLGAYELAAMRATARRYFALTQATDDDWAAQLLGEIAANLLLLATAARDEHDAEQARELLIAPAALVAQLDSLHEWLSAHLQGEDGDAS